MSYIVNKNLNGKIHAYFVKKVSFMGQVFVIKKYNDNGYQYIHPYINSFLYNNNKITKLTFEKYIFDKDNIYLLKKNILQNILIIKHKILKITLNLYHFI